MRFETFLGQSLSLFAREAPLALATMGDHLEGRAVLLGVDGEQALLRRDGGSPAVVSPRASPGVAASEATTSRAALRDLVAGQVTLEEALMSESLWLRGALDDVVALHDLLLAFAGGAARSRGFPALLDAFLSHSPQEDEDP
jgi:hypothetical protein